jgi:hypothetical protein
MKGQNEINELLYKKSLFAVVRWNLDCIAANCGKCVL